MKKVLTPAAGRAALGVMREARGLSERRACRLVGMTRSSYRYPVRRQEPAGLKERLRELAQERRLFG